MLKIFDTKTEIFDSSAVCSCNCDCYCYCPISPVDDATIKTALKIPNYNRAKDGVE